MRSKADLPFHEDEVLRVNKLDALFKDWHQFIKTEAPKHSTHSAEDLVFDGFYPLFSKQKIKLLFVGREALDLSGHNYLEVLWRCYKNGEKIGKQTLNQSRFHSRLFYITYSLNNNFASWNDMPYADIIANQFGIEHKGQFGLSFAFMNLSKFSNDSGRWQSDWSLINHSTSSSTQKRNFIEEEIGIIDPDIIITMGLQDKLYLFGDHRRIGNHGRATAFRTSKGTLLIDTYHFSYWRANTQDEYIFPIGELVKKHYLC